MKIITLLFLALFCISVSNAQKKPIENQKSPRFEKLINSQWTFNYFPDEEIGKGYELPGFDDSKWPAISLPHTWNSYETTGELHLFIRNTSETDNSYWQSGWGWYRKHFSVNKDYADRKVFIKFKGVQKYCKVWLNGKYLGDHKDNNDSFDFDVTGFYKPGADNVLAIAVNNKLDESENYSTDEKVSNVFGGIYGDVNLILTNKLHIPMEGPSGHNCAVIVNTPQVSEKEGIVNVKTIVKNDNAQKKTCTLQISIADANNKIVQVIKSVADINQGQSYTFDQTSKSINNPQIWSPKNPYVYKVYAEVIDKKVVVDKFEVSSGLKFTLGNETTDLIKGIRNHNVFEEVFVNRMKETGTNITHVASVEEPVKIVLVGSEQKISADRGSVVTITADIVDSKGNHVPVVTNTIKWIVSGPATIAGPSVYESEINNHHQMAKVWYREMPVSNLIRSTGKPGKINVTVLASGLASGSFDISAEEIKPDNSVINEPVLSDEGRLPVARIILNVKRLEEIPQEIMPAVMDIIITNSDKSGYAKSARSYILKNNPSVDSTSFEFIALVNLLALQLNNNNGQLIAQDYNLNVEHYNNCRLISGYINSTKLPQLFKDGLKKYYADSIIGRGSEKDAGEEMNWLNWIPSGGTVVISQEGALPGVKGVILTGKSELTDIISVVYPVFTKYNDDAKERALTFISKMNPYIKAASRSDQNSTTGNEKMTNLSLTAEKGKPILIPLLKFISE
jgi:hypothetical protein